MPLPQSTPQSRGLHKMTARLHFREPITMPLLLSAALLLITTTSATSADQPAKPADIHAANKKLGRGINLGNALEAPKEGAWGVTLQAEYFKTIKDAGFASVRLPVKWSAHAQADAPYTIDPKFAARGDWAIDQALANQLNIIVNVHHYDEMASRPDDH